VTIFLVILAILLLGGTAVLASERPLPAGLRRLGGRSGDARRDGPDRASDGDPGGESTPVPTAPSSDLGLVQPVASLPPVLLPESPSGEDVDAVRFGLGLRGYRMDQVDEVLDRLAAELDRRDAVIARLRAQLGEGTAGG
jgi:DivIVA domain-containing protein